MRSILVNTVGKLKGNFLFTRGKKNISNISEDIDVLLGLRNKLTGINTALQSLLFADRVKLLLIVRNNKVR